MGACHSRQGGPGDRQTHPETGRDDIRLKEQLGDIKHKLLVMSGKGGLGKTSVGSLATGPNFCDHYG